MIRSKYNGKGDLSTETLKKLCDPLNRQPGDLMGYVPDDQRSEGPKTPPTTFRLIGPEKQEWLPPTPDKKCTAIETSITTP
ncbi:MAG: helix-turn-helix transcriptional regulator [Lachnospiraceae bacterium]|nr:helix-turn-helix transcriptional regulator [Lachnospiraceae bacterium]